MPSNLPDNWDEWEYERVYDKTTVQCEDCMHWHMCDCGDHGYCDELLEFTDSDDMCEDGEV